VAATLAKTLSVIGSIEFHHDDTLLLDNPRRTLPPFRFCPRILDPPTRFADFFGGGLPRLSIVVDVHAALEK